MSGPPPPGAGSAAADLDALATFLERRRFRFANEKELQRAVAAAFDAEAVGHRREVPLGPKSVVDFLVDLGGPGGARDPDPDGGSDPVADSGPPGLALEVKLAGTSSTVAAQLLRYAASPRVAGTLLLTTRSRHLIYPGPTLGGKPFRAVVLRGGF